jgi:8-amino-7-oxononanoate synthase
MTVFAAQLNDLANLKRQDQLRMLAPRIGADFSSNDYIGLAASPKLKRAIAAALERGVPVGSGGSRLLRGNHPEHEALEAEAATFFGTQSALYFSSGFAANVALLATLPQRGDLVVYDASSHEGLRLCRAEARPARHNDAEAIEAVIGDWWAGGGTGRVWIALESLYSMDGDKAALADIATVADRHDAILIIDEAHATGVFGPKGSGLAAELRSKENIISLHTCGKALGCEGALVTASRAVKDHLINRARGFVFSTAPSPLMASAVRAALDLLQSEPDRRADLAALCAQASIRLSKHLASPAQSQIIPIIIGDDRRTMEVAASLQQAGFDVRGIRPPTVPAGTSRLRISITLNVGAAEIDALADALNHALS